MRLNPAKFNSVLSAFLYLYYACHVEIPSLHHLHYLLVLLLGWFLS